MLSVRGANEVREEKRFVVPPIRVGGPERLNGRLCLKDQSVYRVREESCSNESHIQECTAFGSRQ